MTYACFPICNILFQPHQSGLRQSVYNLWTPIARKKINDHDCRITSGFVRVGIDGLKRMSVLLYIDKDLDVKFIDSESLELYLNTDIVGEFNNVEEAKEYAELFLSSK